MKNINLKMNMIIMVFCAAIMSVSAQNMEDSKAKVSSFLQKELRKNDVHNLLLSIYSPSHQLEWNFAYGRFKDGEKVVSSNPFYTASIGKTFTAVGIAILVEQGHLSFDDKIGIYLDASVMRNLHVMDNIEYSSDITIAHLLQHTSGLPDYFEGETIDGSSNMMSLLFEDPEKFWNKEELIQFSKEKMKPHFKPGGGYHYSDTEYILLGLLIEEISKIALEEFFIKKIFQPLNMENSYMNLRSNPLEETDRMTELYVGDLEISGLRSLSADWAGGGIVSTSADLIKFQHALFSGELINDSTLNQMQCWIPETKGMYYGFGLRKINFKKLFPILPDIDLIGHSGSNASFVYYAPELDLYLAGSLNQTEEVKASVKLMIKIISAIQKDL